MENKQFEAVKLDPKSELFQFWKKEYEETAETFILELYEVHIDGKHTHWIIVEQNMEEEDTSPVIEILNVEGITSNEVPLELQKMVSNLVGGIDFVEREDRWIS